jgi:hypothetical protein
MDPHAPLFPVLPGSTSPGISYHDWLAAVALQAFTTKGLEVRADRAMTDAERDLMLATRAYQLADAMLLARAAAAKERARLAKAEPARPEPPSPRPATRS